MRIFKSHPLLKLVNSYVVDSPQPSNLSYLWNFGSLLAFCLIIQIVTGVTLAMHYNASVMEAFNSVEHIMRDVNNGWLIRYLHSNTASAFFFLVYLHIGRNLYYASYKAPRTLTFAIGVVILVVMMATAFLGYVLPYGQMSLWGATVITNLMSAIPWIGQDIVEFIWGGFSVNNATLNRFFALHFVLPFVIAALVLMHLIALHDSAGSSNPLGVSGNYDRLPFAPYFIFKDLVTIFLFILIISIFVFFMPNVLGDSENYVVANPMQTPPAIVPEWYLLPFYAILRSIPNKLLGVIAMFAAILILLALPFTDLSRTKGAQFKPLSKVAFYIFVANFLMLMQLGAKHVESPFIELGQVSTVIYFAYFLLLVPQVTLVENSFVELPKYKGATNTSEESSNEDNGLYNKLVHVNGNGNPLIGNVFSASSILALVLGFIFAYNLSDFNLLDLFNNLTDVALLGPIVTMPMPGIKCPKCSAKGVESWVLQGKNCSKCGHPCSGGCGKKEKGVRRPVKSDNQMPVPGIVVEGAETPVSDTNSGTKPIPKPENKGNPAPKPTINKCMPAKLPQFMPHGQNEVEVESRYKPTNILYNVAGSFVLVTWTCGLIFGGIITWTMMSDVNLLDAPRPWGLYFQDSASPQMEGLVELHDNIMFYLTIILYGVGWILASVIKNYSYKVSPISNKYLNHGTLLELVWTISPAVVLILIAFPSFKLLFLMDEVSDPALAVLAEGHQWYWSYQYPDFGGTDQDFVEYDSYLVPEADLEEGALRQLEVDNRVMLPWYTHVRFLVTAADVIHSFACPSLGIKSDAYPGRLSQSSILINREGVFYGQCSEICGILHSSMPLAIESLPVEKFLTFLKEQ